MPAGRGSIQRGALIAAGIVAAAALVVEAAPHSAASGRPARRPPPSPAGTWGAGNLPAPVAPAFAVPPPRPLRASANEVRWAPVKRPVLARATPALAGAAVTRLSLRTPEDTSNLVLVLGARHGPGGRLWIHVLLPILPPNTTGWVERSALGGYRFVNTRLVVDVRTLRATLFRERRVVFRAPVGVGTAATPTPRGSFYIRDRLTRYASPFYGPIAFGTSARSAFVTDWPDGGFVGIHGTDQPWRIPGRVSHGCIRMRNHDIMKLARLMPVGTPMLVR
jgi:hypothetical protein